MRELFPQWLEIDNPVDVWIPVARDFERAFPKILDCITKDEAVDAVVCIYCSYTLPKYEQFNASKFIAPAAKRYPSKPIVCWSYGMDIAGFSRLVERDGTTMVFRSLEDATLALAKLREYQQFLDRQVSRMPVADYDVDDDAVSAVLARSRQTHANHLFVDAMHILDSYGVPTATWSVAKDMGELERIADRVAYPVCMKVVSSDIVHKSESGGIVLGIEISAGATRWICAND